MGRASLPPPTPAPLSVASIHPPPQPRFAAAMAAAKQTRSQSLPWGMRKSNFGVTHSSLRAQNTSAQGVRRWGNQQPQQWKALPNISPGFWYSYRLPVFTYTIAGRWLPKISVPQDITRINYVQYTQQFELHNQNKTSSGFKSKFNRLLCDWKFDPDIIVFPWRESNNGKTEKTQYTISFWQGIK
jgi:hypothetical protein